MYAYVMDKELETMLRLDLRDYLAKDGYYILANESSENSFKMRGPNGVLVLRQRDDGVWQYFNPQDDKDNGTIIQYLQRRRQGFTLGHVKQHLRPHVGRLLPQLPRGGSRPVAVAPRDLSQVVKRWNSARPVWGELPPYLAARGLSAPTVAAYAATLRVDRRGNILFGHTNDAGQIVGYEIKGPTFTGYAKGGVRMLCRMGSEDGATPDKIALTESGVDALSLAQLVGRRNALYLSTGGALSVHTLNAIKATAARFPAAEILLAFDNDQGGETFAAQVEQALAGRSGVRRLVPKVKDWNDQLRNLAKPRAAAPAP